jgi:hypothetical protein
MMQSTFGWLAVLTTAALVSPSLRAQTVTADFDDLTQVPAAKKILDDAAGQLKKVAQGNESGVTVKSARGKNVTFDLQTKKPVAGEITVVFDLHHRHRTTPDREVIIDTPFGKIKQKIPGIVAYDRHDEVVAEYDIKAGRGKARLAKGPVKLPLIPEINWELWVNLDLKNQ